MRYFIELSYDGGNYHGWQIQNNAMTVQQELNEALSKILRVEIKTTGSGRTDTGVHALHQVAHFDFDGKIKNVLCDRLNSLLSKQISVQSVKQVSDEANARYDATHRSYIYKINKNKNPFEEGRSYWFSRPLNMEGMNACCQEIKTWTDFECFSKVHTDVNNFNCEIFEAKWIQTNDGFEFYVSANRFLRGMVRAMVGTMMLVGEGKIAIPDFIKVLESRDRKQAGSSVPAHGLYLSEVNYPKEVYL